MVLDRAVRAGGGAGEESVAAAADECGVRVVDVDRVAAVRAVLPEDTETEELARIFGLLAEPGRLKLISGLLAAGEICVCDLAAVSRMSESSVSHALRLLRAARVVTVHRRGRMAYYRLDDDHVQLLLGLGLTHIRHAAGQESPVAELSPLDGPAR